MSQRKMVAVLIVIIPVLVLTAVALLVPHDPAHVQEAADGSFRSGLVIGAAFWSRYWIFTLMFLLILAWMVSKVLLLLRVP